jgi:hypothetical protein
MADPVGVTTRLTIGTTELASATEAESGKAA